jgi:hypothetical protein
MIGKRGVFHTDHDGDFPGTFVACEDGVGFQTDRQFIADNEKIFDNYEDEERHGFFLPLPRDKRFEVINV